MTELTNDERADRLDGPVHLYFGLSYCNYEVLHRSLMQSMPVEWQARMVGLLEEFNAAFAHTEHAPIYEVTAATECTYSDLSEAGMRQLGVTQPDAPDGDDEDAELSDVYYDRDGEEHDGEDRVLVPLLGGDPVPHYRRGRTFVEPQTVAAPVVTEWATEQHWPDGTAVYKPASNEAHAGLTATLENHRRTATDGDGSIVGEVFVVCREVRELSDGSTLTGPWVRVHLTLLGPPDPADLVDAPRPGGES